MGMAALDAGKHLYCEWPLAATTEQAPQMRDLAVRKEVRHMVDYKPAGAARSISSGAEGIREGRSVSPDFDVAVKHHQLLDVIQKASDTGIRQILYRRSSDRLTTFAGGVEALVNQL
jgi:predicted dehydrogenase